MHIGMDDTQCVPYLSGTYSFHVDKIIISKCVNHDTEHTVILFNYKDGFVLVAYMEIFSLNIIDEMQ